MKLDQIEWEQGCCGESYKYAEVNVPSGWLRIKQLPEGGFKVTRFGPDQKLLAAETEMTAEEVEALL